jgi:hypothetical protein
LKSRHNKRIKHPPPPKRARVPARRAPVLFEQFTLNDLQRWAAWGAQGRLFHSKWYNDLAYQRSLILDKIRSSLAAAAEPFPFQDWQRVGRYKYALHPLSIQGSLKMAGRFNIANLDPTQFSPFPALYLASNRETAMQEVLGQDASATGALTAFDLALAKPDAIFNVPVRGALQRVINLDKPEKLQPFMDLIKDFSLDPEIVRMATSNSMPPPFLIRTVEKLIEAVVWPDWRQWPALFAVPSTSQLLAQLALDAGVEGIVYRSKFNGQQNLAAFPQAFTGTSYIELADDAPPEVKIRRLDTSTAKALT